MFVEIHNCQSYPIEFYVSLRWSYGGLQFSFWNFDLKLHSYKHVFHLGE
jgi:hypothetical protein